MEIGSQDRVRSVVECGLLGQLVSQDLDARVSNEKSLQLFNRKAFIGAVMIETLRLIFSGREEFPIQYKRRLITLFVT